MSTVYLNNRVLDIAKSNNIDVNMTHEIVIKYLSYCKDELFSGKVVVIPDLFRVEPDVVTSDLKSTLAYDCNLIADELGLPRHTVYTVIRGYIDDLIESIMAGDTASVRGIANIHPYMGYNGKVAGVTTAISATLKDNIPSDAPINSVRVYTSKFLKHRIECEAYA